MMKQPTDPSAIAVWKSLSEKKTALLIRRCSLLVKGEKYQMVKLRSPTEIGHSHHFMRLLERRVVYREGRWFSVWAELCVPDKSLSQQKYPHCGINELHLLQTFQPYFCRFKSRSALNTRSERELNGTLHLALRRERINLSVGTET